MQANVPSRDLLLGLSGVLLIACGPPPRGHAVYDASQGQLPLDQVAQLSGQIIAIDGQPVPPGADRFEVLPRCHTLRMTGMVNYAAATQSSSMRLYIGEREFALNAEAGHQYFVELSHGDVGGTVIGPVQTQWTVRQFDQAGNEGPLVPLYAGCR